MKCYKCDKEIDEHVIIRESKTNREICFKCGDEIDKEFMKSNGKNVLYLSKIDSKFYVTNCASLKLPVYYSRTSRTNWGDKRTDVWFGFEGNVWWGRNQGDNDILYCKKTKEVY